MIVAIVIVAVIVGLVVLMRWADRRDRAKGHANRDTRSTNEMLRSRKQRKSDIQFYGRDRHDI